MDAHEPAGPRTWRSRLPAVVGTAAAVGVALVLLGGCAMLKVHRIPSSAMEPHLHCPKPGGGCEGDSGDRILVRRFLPGEDPGRGDVIVFDTPPQTEARCGSGGVFVKRVIGLPNETVTSRSGVVASTGARSTSHMSTARAATCRPAGGRFPTTSTSFSATTAATRATAASGDPSRATT
jgi:hypothetical protein